MMIKTYKDFMLNRCENLLLSILILKQFKNYKYSYSNGSSGNNSGIDDDYSDIFF